MEAGRLSVLHRKHAWRRTPRYTDTRDTQCPSQATPFTFADARGQTPRSFLRAGSPTWKRELPAPVISRSWICLGPLTHLGRDPRSSQEPGAGRKPEALRLPTPPSPPQPGPAFTHRARKEPSPITWSRPLNPRPSRPRPFSNSNLRALAPPP